jgi:hypothetical protein
MSFSAESFEKWSSGGKNCLQGIFFIIVLVAIFSSRAQAWLGREFAFLSSAGVESVKIGELEFKLRQAREAALTIANNPPAAPSDQPRQAPQDKPPTPNLAPALETISTPGMFWVYLGQYQQGRFLHQPNFTLSSGALPKPTETLSANTDTYERDALPVQVGTEWRLGNIVGVVRQGQSILVRQVNVIQGGNVWIHADITR